MKRSKMAAIIAEYFKESDVSDIEENADYHGRIILAILESEGMRPPLKHPIHHYHLDQIQTLDATFGNWEDE